ncbi:MAG TPA: HEAT repeat domain-containing protein, partial [Methanotrichaceae archaeon]|nr:HEAT repeat domain-containing protein [Methanotrichaceae archaeon]
PTDMRKDAVKMLVNLGAGSEMTAGALEKLLRDQKEDHRIRLLAARALGQIGCKSSLQALIQSLDDEYPSVRHEAISALGRTGDKDACAALTKLLESESCYVRGAAARALIQIFGVPIPEKENIERLTKLLCSGDIRVKEALLCAGPPATAALTAMRDNDSFSMRSLAAQTLALHVRRIVDQLPPGRCVFPWLEDQGVFIQSIGNLYSSRITRCGGEVTRVENSGFDSISRTLCGERPLQLSPTPLSSASLSPTSLSPASLSSTSGSSAALAPGPNDESIKTIELVSLLSKYGACSLMRMGRTLVAPLAKGRLAIKLCVRDGDEIRLLHEAWMQKHLQGLCLSSRLPRPLGGLFRIDGLPPWIEAELGVSHARGICYIAGPDYFQYLSDPALPEDEVRSGLASCAEDLARLAGIGLIHTSLIPLFHNRERTTDGDCTYRWNRKLAGRLDNWRESCRFPNLRQSGIADLEHIELHSQISSQALQAYAGEHLFSMSLVLGCYFCRRGSFDQKAMSQVLKDCFKRYYRALTGSEPEPLDVGIDWDHLACRMAEEMGAEHASNGIDAPGRLHLGIHNGPFPIPELLRAVHIASTLAVLELQACHQTKGG